MLTNDDLQSILTALDECKLGHDYNVPNIPYLYARKNKITHSLIVRASIQGKRFTKQIGTFDNSVNHLNQQLSYNSRQIAYLKGEEQKPLTLMEMVNLYFIPLIKREHRDFKTLLSRLKIIQENNPHLFELELSSIKKLDVITTINQLRQRNVSPSTLNRYRYALQAVFALAVEMELIDKNPVKTVKKEKECNIQSRVLRGDELAHFIKYASTYSNPYAGNVLILLLFTGMRATEALTLKWSMLSLCRNYLDLPMTKNGQPRRVYLNQSAQNVIAYMEELQMNEFVFFSTHQRGHLTYPRAALEAVCKQMELNGVLTAPFTLHSLRHTFATQLAEVAQTLRDVQIAIGHSSSVTTERYTHLSNEHMSNSVSLLDGVFNFEPDSTNGEQS